MQLLVISPIETRCLALRQRGKNVHDNHIPPTLLASLPTSVYGIRALFSESTLLLTIARTLLSTHTHTHTHTLSLSLSPSSTTVIMAGKKTENTKKAAGNAKKAEAAAAKAAVEQSKKDQAEAEDWGKGAKSNAKKYRGPSCDDSTERR